MHVSLLNNSHKSRGITWFTDQANGADAPGAMVQWSHVEPTWSGNDIVNLVDHPFSNITFADSTPTTGVEAQTHKVSLQLSKPELAIRYRVGSDEGGWSPIFTVPASAPADESWHFVHFGDHGVGPLAQRLTAELNKPQYHHDLLLLAGDISYANGEQSIWDTWFEQNQSLIASTVTMAVPGNHESKDIDQDDSFFIPLGEDAALFRDYAFNNRFHHPGGNSFYGFDYNRVHFFGFTGGAFIEDGKILPEIVTMEASLAQAAARRALGLIDFIVVFQHYTIWTDQDGRGPGNASLILVQDQMMARYGVDLVLCGHDHVYQRSAQMILGQRSPLGYVQVMAGTGGESIRDFDDEIQDWSEKEFKGIGFCRYEVSPGLIKVDYFGSKGINTPDTPDGVGSQIIEAMPIDINFECIDSFEVHARKQLLSKKFLKPARSATELAKAYNWDAIIAHTNLRNKHHGHA
tara:strand:+ start:6060 stop:7445 length:1386 start_codon:yes stop_codon:yes gene_type:complete